MSQKSSVAQSRQNGPQALTADKRRGWPWQFPVATRMRLNGRGLPYPWHQSMGMSSILPE
ncbi:MULTISPECIES: hypothetical protein [Albidovulum]|uniref:hypothetical protein n=1 Tax=Albidovulum TaxID=205889 RepID=UPI0021E02B6A|nr:MULTISPECIES: hypothetical protein [Defluviimonas]